MNGLLDGLRPGADRQTRARAAIISAAVAVFVERGIAATRVEDILRAADVSRRTFYKYFANKHAVLIALYEILSDELVAEITASVAGGGDPIAAIGDALDSYLRVHLSHAAIVRMLIEEAVQSDSPLAPLRATFRGKVVIALDAVFAMTAGIRVDSLVSLALVSALEGLSLELLSGEASDADIARTRAVVLGLVEVVLAGAAKLPRA